MLDGRTKHRCRAPLRCVATLTALLIAAGCGGDSTQPQISEAGTYSITSINGRPLPDTIEGTLFGTVVIQDATVVLTPGTPSQFSADILGTQNGAGTTLLSTFGTYVRSGASLTFTVNGSPPLTGTFDNNGHVVVVLPGAAIGTVGILELRLTKRPG